jgi:hypothetical protein
MRRAAAFNHNKLDCLIFALRRFFLIKVKKSNFAVKVNFALNNGMKDFLEDAHTLAGMVGRHFAH